ncbi:hypothetical protein PV10_00566 [Exophiala mesophila]|uniref:Zn(2)-C6 fungal-type domain-containing protein n=1 Tax=Exophiala mesophila TaxID=212818 RepID=A0A0D1ZQ48_EXOME|nr:uncharacterized protein PV10_00566 [Exophiala mesophila]KIV96742.1 hypothetical protein PV10_00566 [Exophiala mesophila]
MDAGSRDVRLRVQSARSSSGCQTCKTRRVKCDEGRPQCQKCLKGQRICEYSPQAAQEPSHKFVIYSNTVSRELSRTPDLFDSEKRALQYFRHRAGLQITAPFQSELWRGYVFQLADQYSFVMSALIALSSMHESYSRQTDLRARLYSDAIHHYNKTIRDISQAAEEQLPLDAVLVTVILFHSLDCLRGCYHLALQHAQSGVKIISDGLQVPGRHPSTQLSEILSRDFLALQNQVRDFGNSDALRAFDAMNGFQPAVSDRFSSVEEAAHHLEIVYNELYCLSDYCKLLQTSHVDLAAVFMTDIQPRHAAIAARFSSWIAGMNRLEEIIDGEEYGEQSGAWLILKIFQSLFTAMIKSFPNGDCFDRFDVDLSRALELAEIFLRRQDHPTNSDQSTFSMSLGVIPVLFVIAWRSNDPFIRGKSLELLELSDRREGVWDSKVALKLAQRYSMVRDRFLYVQGERVGHMQIHDIIFQSETMCQLTCTIVGPHTLPSGEFMPFEGVAGERRFIETIQLEERLGH